MLKKIRTPIRFQHHTEDPHYPVYFQFSDSNGANPRQIYLDPGRYFFLISGDVDDFYIETSNNEGGWEGTDISANPTVLTVKFNGPGLGKMMARKSSSDKGDAHMVIIAPPISRLLKAAAAWR